MLAYLIGIATNRDGTQLPALLASIAVLTTYWGRGRRFVAPAICVGLVLLVHPTSSLGVLAAVVSPSVAIATAPGRGWRTWIVHAFVVASVSGAAMALFENVVPWALTTAAPIAISHWLSARQRDGKAGTQ